MPTLKINNFQSIRSAELDIAPFTVIVGPSDSGKSALVRALEACLFNTEGTDYVTWGASKCSVSFLGIEFAKGSTSSYVMDGKLFTAIGRGPFEEVGKRGFREMDVDQITVRPQLSKQYDLPFLISPIYTPSIISSLLGTLSDSTLLARAKKSAEKDTKEVESEIRAKEESLRDTEERLVRVKILEEALAPKVLALESLSSQVSNTTEKLHKLSYVKTNFEDSYKQFKYLEKRTMVLSGCVRIMEPHAKSAELYLGMLQHRQELLASYYGARAAVGVARDKMARLQAAVADKAALVEAEKAAGLLAKAKPYLALISTLVGLIEALKAALAKAREVFASAPRFFDEFEMVRERQSRVVEYAKIQTEAADLRVKMATIAAISTKLITEIAKFDSCPLCGSALKDHAA